MRKCTDDSSVGRVENEERTIGETQGDDLSRVGERVGRTHCEERRP